MNAFSSDTPKVPAPNKADILAHLTALFSPKFVHPYPDALIEIAYGMPSPNKAELFSAFELNAAAEFAVIKNLSGCNVYVGTTLKKGSTATSARTNDGDFLAGNWAWTDHDAAGDFDQAMSKGKEHSLKPGMIVQTGTVPHVRAHCYFKIEGGVTDAEQMRDINTLLQQCLGGDKVQNPSRIMRLAGTVNYPKPAKRERGYVVELVEVRVQQAPHEHQAATLRALEPEPKARPTTAAAPPLQPRKSLLQPLSAGEPDPFWRNVNSLAMSRLSDWVPIAFPKAHLEKNTGAWRVTSRDLKRNLEEDLSISPKGIKDWGVADMGDPKDGKRSPIDLLIEHGIACDAVEAAHWLCDRCSVAPASLGWRLQLDPSDPMRSASLIVAEKYTQDGSRTLHRHRGAFWEWNGAYYREADDESIRASVWAFLDAALCFRRSALVPFKPKPGHVNAVIDAMGAICHLDSHIAPPTWLNGNDGPNAEELFAVRNGLLHLPTRELHPPTPNFFNLSASDVAFDPNAPRPEQWLNFINQALGDAESIQALQEWFGYTIAPDTSQQKIMLNVGPRRSGKGTTARILTALAGGDSVAGPTMSSLGSQFGLEPLITKPLAIVSDARIGAMTDKSAITERLLSISGEDTLTVDRKFKSAWHGQLPTRFMILTNELPSFTEGSGALSGRFIMILFPNSMYGKEDRNLTNKLMMELPGILNWALDGYDSLRNRGHFVQPANAQEQLEQIELLGAPVKAFVKEWCIVEPGRSVTVVGLWEAYQSWCEQEGRRDAGTKTWFGRNLNSAVPGLTISRPRAEGDDRLRTYEGIGLRSLDRVKEELERAERERVRDSIPL